MGSPKIKVNYSPSYAQSSNRNPAVSPSYSPSMHGMSPSSPNYSPMGSTANLANAGGSALSPSYSPSLSGMNSARSPNYSPSGAMYPSTATGMVKQNYSPSYSPQSANLATKSPTYNPNVTRPSPSYG